MINREKLICDVTEKTGYNRKDTKQIIDTFIDTMREYFIAGETIKIIGLFTASVKEYEAHIAKNPKTNEEIQVPARRKVRFKTSEKLNDEVNEGE